MIGPIPIEDERWAPVPWYPARYIVSSLGRVYNKETGKFKTAHMLWSGRTGRRPKDSIVVRLHRIDQDNTGRHQVEVAKIVARLVLEAFIGPCPIRGVARARDGNLDNPTLENLYWGPRTNRHKCDKFATKLTWEQADQIRTRSVDHYYRDRSLPYDRRDSLVHIAREFGVSKTMVADIRDGRSWVRDGARIVSPEAGPAHNWSINDSENSGISTYDRQWRL